MKYLCKQSYFSDEKSYLGEELTLVFEEGKWYEVDIDDTLSDDNDAVYYDVHRIGSRYRLTFVDDRFADHFYSVSELRELEINKIIDG
tara:strand:- start:127673 stop:127936 length:264 start_codon:yes stop_codon:yes gene_type:complete